MNNPMVWVTQGREGSHEIWDDTLEQFWNALSKATELYVTAQEEVGK